MTYDFLKEMIDEIVIQEFDRTSHSLNALKKSNSAIANMSQEDFEKFLRGLLRKKYGQAHLHKGDMATLDKITRPLLLLPYVGRAYRKGLAKYLRSKDDTRYRDPYADFRKYSYKNEPDPIY